jgi:hypothetical protein
MRFLLFAFVFIGLLTSCQKENRNTYFKRPEGSTFEIESNPVIGKS